MRQALTTVLLLLWSCALFASSSDRPITIVYNQGIAPIKFTDRNGNPSGLLNEYWQLLSQKNNQKFLFREVETFRESLELVKSGAADLHAGLFFTEERSQYLLYSHPIFDLQFHMYTTADLLPPPSLLKAKGLLVGVVAGGYPEKFVAARVPAGNVVKYKNYRSMFKSVLAGELKVFISSDIHLNYYLSINNLENPFQKSDTVLFEQSYFGATAPKNHALMATIKKEQGHLRQEDKQRLRNRWLNFKIRDVDGRPVPFLTQEESRWIKEHPVLKVSNEMDWPPFDFNMQGRPQGFSIDVLEMISKRVGLQLEYVYGYSWNELMEMLHLKKIDVIHSLNRNELREKFTLFTKPYVSNQSVIVTSKDNLSIKSTSDLHHKTIAVIDGYNQKHVLKTKFEDVHFVSVSSPLAALRAVSSGRADATIRFNAVANYLIHHHLLTNLKYVDEFEVKDDELKELHIGVRNDWPILQSIMQKGLNAISREEMNALKQKWFFLDQDKYERKGINLTEEEQNWIRKHPEVTLGADFNWPPFEFEDDKGLHTGLASDYLKHIEQRSGLKFKVQTGVWSEVLSKMQNGAFDGLACAVATGDRAKYLDFSRPYIKVPLVIVTQKNNHDIHGLDDLKGKTVSINKGSYLHEWFQDRYPQIKLHLSTSNQASIEAVSYGEADVYLGNLAVANYLIRKQLLPNLKVVKKIEAMSTATSVAIDKSQPILMGIVQKALDDITPREHRAILDKWYVAVTQNKISLTQKEQQWIQKHPVIRLSGDHAWAPMSYRDEDNEYIGIVPDFFKLIEERSGLAFETIAHDSWTDVLKACKDGKIDVIDAITENAERGKAMHFTDVYLTGDVVLITRDDIQYIRGLKNVGDRKVGTVKDYTTETHIREDFPEINLNLYTTASDGLKALSAGDVDVFVIDIPTFEFYRKKSSLANLKISGFTPYAFQLAIGVRKGLPELVSILNKSLGRITQKETNEIYNRWVTLDEPLIDYSLIAKVALVAGVCLVAIGYWNRRLSHEASLRKTAEAAALQAAKAKSDFLAHMSHEIRTPMNSVLGFAEILDHRITDPEQKNYLKSIRTSGKNLLGIINDILDLSKIEAGKMPLKPEPTSMQKIFSEMNDFFQRRMEQKRLKFNCVLDPAFPPYVLIDGPRFQQILINLIGNALKFTETGQVDLIGKDVRINEDSRTVNFSVCVADTGVGIDEAQLDRVFEKFQQQEGQDSVRYGGTGLGLSICKNLTAMMGGDITVESALGKGSSFLLKFKDIPITDRLIENDRHQVLNPAGFKKADILVVDDVEDNRYLLASFFKGSALKIHEAENGRDALQMLHHRTVDLIFLDLRMPIMNGYETISMIREDNRLKQIPVIAVTASVLNEDIEKVDQYGFSGYLRKPIQRQALYSAAAKYLPYQEGKKTDPVEAKMDLPDGPMTHLDRFLIVAKEQLLPEWHRVKDRGDFEMIGQFATQLERQSTQYGIHRMTQYAKRLKVYVDSFDILEVDGLMKQFPESVQTLQKMLAGQNRG